jgi:hypothetical protein
MDKPPLERATGAHKSFEVRPNTGLTSKPYVVVDADSQKRLSTHTRRDEALKEAERLANKS